jgi:hypothetical protein
MKLVSITTATVAMGNWAGWRMAHKFAAQNATHRFLSVLTVMEGKFHSIVANKSSKLEIYFSLASVANLSSCPYGSIKLSAINNKNNIVFTTPTVADVANPIMFPFSENYQVCFKPFILPQNKHNPSLQIVL